MRNKTNCVWTNEHTYPTPAPGMVIRVCCGHEYHDYLVAQVDGLKCVELWRSNLKRIPGLGYLMSQNLRSFKDIPNGWDLIAVWPNLWKYLEEKDE